MPLQFRRMTCTDVRKLIETTIGESMDPIEWGRQFFHLKRCPACSKFYIRLFCQMSRCTISEMIAGKIPEIACLFIASIDEHSLQKHLAEFAGGALTKHELSLVRDHLCECDECQNEVDSLLEKLKNSQ